ncbi:MAG TPA: heavy metal-binding domain-containing protein, partial [Blastocatellia bacterium]|nr:heavy metal-binding domain-containing protein [Blastocatellia bacterium]
MNRPVDTQAGVKDIVCGMTVDPASAASSSTHEGRSYYFCSVHCLEKFSANPAGYATKAVPVALVLERNTAKTAPPVLRGTYTCPMHPDVSSLTPASCPRCGMALEPLVPIQPKATTEYVCPMHPEIVEAQPGPCPICGMALEPKFVTTAISDEASPELRDMTRRFIISACLTIPLVFLGMSDLIPGQPIQHSLSPDAVKLIELLLASPVVIWGGWPFFQRGVMSVANRSLNMFTLIAIGTGVAYGYSLIATLFPGLFAQSLRNQEMGLPVYFEAAAAITALVQLGQILELRARSRTGNAIKALLGLSPKTARLLGEAGSEIDVPLEHVKVADRLR